MKLSRNEFSQYLIQRLTLKKRIGEQMNRPSDLQIKTIVGLCLLLEVLSAPLRAETILLTPNQRSQLGIKTQQVMLSHESRQARFSAEVIVPPAQSRMVTSAQPGLVEAIYVSAGDQVKKGQKLAHILSTTMLVQQRDYLQSKSRLKLAESNLSRDEALVKDGIIPERRYRETKSQFDEAQAAYAQQQQSLRLSGFSEQHLQQMTDAKGMQKGVTLVAPFSGVITEQMVSVGQRIDEMTPVLLMANLDQLWLEIFVPMSMASQVKVGNAVTFANENQAVIEANVTSVVPQLNKSNQVLQVRAQFHRGKQLIYPGQRLDVLVALGQSAKESTSSDSMEARLKLPKTAIVRNGQQAFVYREVSGGFSPVPVNVISNTGEFVLVSGSLSVEDRVVTHGVVALKGMVMGMGGE